MNSVKNPSPLRTHLVPSTARKDPSMDPQPISEKDIGQGMMNLVNRGVIPRDVDLGPAFERGIAPV